MFTQSKTDYHIFSNYPEVKWILHPWKQAPNYWWHHTTRHQGVHSHPAPSQSISTCTV